MYIYRPGDELRKTKLTNLETLSSLEQDLIAAVFEVCRDVFGTKPMEKRNQP